MIICMLVAVFEYDIEEKVPARLVGNPEQDPGSFLAMIFLDF